MRLLSFIKKNRGGVFAVAILGILILVDYYKCPIYAIFGVNCPTCGVTRALLSLIRLDFLAYVKYNAMAIFLLTAVLAMICRYRITNKLMVDIYVYSVLAVNTVYYVLRLIFLK